MRIVSGALCVAVSVGVLGIVHAPDAHAYSKTGCHWAKGQSIAYSKPTYYPGTVDNAASRWNAAGIGGMPKLYSYNGSPVHGMEIIPANYGNVSWDGYSYWNCSGGVTTGGNIKLNTYYLGQARYTTNADIQVVVHEFGHMLGLNHAGSSTCSGQPIMYYSSDRYFSCGHVSPQTDDKNGLNSVY